MSLADDQAAHDAAADAALIAALCAVDPVGLGGVVLRGYAGPAREAWLDHAKRLLPAGSPLKRLPHGISDDRLLGGLDLTASLARGAPVLQKGVLAEADGGTLVIAMAERLPGGVAARIVAAMDRGTVALAREGFSAEHPARFGVIALDEGLDDDEVPPPALLDRLAFRIDLGRLGRDEPLAIDLGRGVEAARARLGDIEIPENLVEALCEAASAFGIHSLRAVRFALNAARAIAALDGRMIVGQGDAALAARLVLSPRATQIPSVEDDESEAETASAEDQAPPDSATNTDQPANEDRPSPEDEEAALDKPLPDVVRQAVRAALPAALLAGLAAGATPTKGGGQGRSEGSRKSAQRGRPIGSMRGELRSGARLALLDTLRAAAPWQKLRRTQLGERQRPGVIVRSDDFRIMRFKQKIRTTTIFVVDASGSAALHRLAEAKGAVELLLADCYVRRDEVALIAFRGNGAEVLLPPTRSLARAKRGLARLPGGGGTPLAAGVRAAHELAIATAKRGDKPVLVFLTDGQANIGFDGVGNRARAQEDATLAARALRVARLPALLIDTSARPQAKAEKLAGEMGARYLPMPSADMARLSRIVQSG